MLNCIRCLMDETFYYHFLKLYLILLQVAHLYLTMRHLTQTHPHAWLPKRVGALYSLPYSLFYTLFMCLYICTGVTVFYQGSEERSWKPEKSESSIKNKKSKFGFTVPALDRHINKNACKAHMYLRIMTPHTNLKPMQSLSATDKALSRCFFCVVKIIWAKLLLQTVLFRSATLTLQQHDVAQRGEETKNKGVLTRRHYLRSERSST